MGKAGDRDVAAGAPRQGRGSEAGVPRPEAVEARGKRWGITRVSDEDYRCVWRPCPALDEDEGGETTG